MPITSSATPLIALDAIVLDTETTGPDASTARIIQIGAVRVVHGEVSGADRYDQLVHPGIPVPESSTAIHGLHDADLEGAPAFDGIRRHLEDYLGEAVIIGHSIGYDLSLLKSETEKTGSEWRRPRSLDTRILARLIKPQMTNYTLDTVSSWLGVEISGRHTALGDAMATAEVFVRMIPHLRELGIRTLGEVEAACRNFSDEFDQHHQIGWVEPVAPAAGVDEMLKSSLARIDSYPYRHKVRDVMSTPPVFVKPGATIDSVLKLLVTENISSVFVEPAKKGGAPGIATERDILRALAGPGTKVRSRKITSAMNVPLQTVRADAFIYRAIARMSRHGFRHLGVEDDRGNVVGALTTRNLLRQRAETALALGDEIDQARGAAELARAWARLPSVVMSLRGEDVDPRDISAVISRELAAITRRAAEISAAAMVEDGLGEAPASYAVIVMGSGGRGESTLAPDQDNGIIFSPVADHDRADKWFAELGVRFSDILHHAGVPYCRGGVMARNKEWRHSSKGWEEAIDGWIRSAEAMDVCYVDIFYDFSAVLGDNVLAGEVWDHAYDRAHRSPGFLKMLAAVATDFRAPVTVFGGIRTESGRVDLKQGALLPIVAGARVLALRHNIHHRSTPERLTAVRDKGVGAASDFDEVMEAHRVLLSMVLDQQLRDIASGTAPSNMVQVSALSRDEQRELKHALRAVEIMNTLVGDPIAFG